MKELEGLYENKLRLEKPVKYWSNRKDTYQRAGKVWTGLLAGVVVLAIVSMISLLYFPPEAFEASLFDGDSGSIKSLAVFVALISFFGFLSSAFAKLAFSSYHLKRDAEEREQLTYVYLSLKKDDQMNNEERELVLQAIFSRADTGLLRGEHAPKMPGISSLMDRVRRQGGCLEYA